MSSSEYPFEAGMLARRTRNEGSYDELPIGSVHIVVEVEARHDVPGRQLLQLASSEIRRPYWVASRFEPVAGRVDVSKIFNREAKPDGY